MARDGFVLHRFADVAVKKSDAEDLFVTRSDQTFVAEATLNSDIARLPYVVKTSWATGSDGILRRSNVQSVTKNNGAP
jgi:hypothetical protein